MLVPMPNAYIALIIVELTAIAIALILYLIEYRKHKTLHEHNDLPMLEKMRAENDKIIQDAIKESHAIIAAAEEEALALTRESKTTTAKVQEAVVKEFHLYLENLQTQSNESAKTIESAARDKINAFIEKFEQNLSDFMIQTQQQSVSAIDLELRSARNLIDTYREQQLKVINENVLAVLERTLTLVLAKRLNLKDHMDLIYESLEKAKAEKFII